VVIEQGLKPGVQLYLNTPQKPENYKLAGVELISVIREREKAKEAEEMRLRKEAEKAKTEGGGMMGRPGGNITPEMMQRFQQMRGNQPGGQNGAPRDTAAMRRFMKMRNGQQGNVRDTSSRRRSNRQPGQQNQGQNGQVSQPATIKN
jgi:hypothetical protein